MKINFPLPTDNKRHRYCQNCYSENVAEIETDKKRTFGCKNCGNSYDRVIDIDPKIVWWIDPNTKEYWHESVGIFVTNNNKELLFFERTIFPYALTIPAGHLDVGEDHHSAAIRELREESGIIANNLVHFKDLDISEDKCRRGADFHKWHVYKYLLKESLEIKTDEYEGKNPVWISLEVVLTKELTPAVKFLLKKYGEELVN